MKTVFFGNHDVGIAVLETLAHNADVRGVIAHPIDPEEGKIFSSLYNFASRNSLKVIRGVGKDAAVLKFVKDIAPDLIWVTDYRYILPKEIITLPTLGAVNLHPSLLPKYRGRASINWAILNGETEIGLTAHFIDEGVDTGDIITQVSIGLNRNQDISDAIAALIPWYRRVTKKVLSFFALGSVPRQAQDHAKKSVFPARSPEDGRIDWTQSAERICNLIRAVSTPYPGAFCEFQGGRLFIWKASVVDFRDERTSEPGTVVAAGRDRNPTVQCGRGCIQLHHWTNGSGAVARLQLNDRLL